MISAFTKNYLYELPEDIQVLIYKKAFKETLNSIRDMREAIDNYDKLVAYIKSNHFNPYKISAIWSIMLCYRKELGDPYYKYFLYYADSETDLLRLNKQKMIKHETAYSSIKYLEFTIYPIQDNVSTDSYISVKKLLEEYTDIFLSNYSEKYTNIKGIELFDDKIRIVYNDSYIFTCSIDIYNNILDSYNFIICIFHILHMYNNLYPRYNLEFMNDLDDLREWFEYNSFFCGFTLNKVGDTIKPSFHSARYI
jgi:hypothetical protein